MKENTNTQENLYKGFLYSVKICNLFDTSFEDNITMESIDKRGDTFAFISEGTDKEICLMENVQEVGADSICQKLFLDSTHPDTEIEGGLEQVEKHDYRYDPEKLYKKPGNITIFLLANIDQVINMSGNLKIKENTLTNAKIPKRFIMVQAVITINKPAIVMTDDNVYIWLLENDEVTNFIVPIHLYDKWKLLHNLKLNDTLKNIVNGALD